MLLEYCCWCEMPTYVSNLDAEVDEETILEVLPPRIPLDVWFPGLRKFPD